VIEEFEQLLRDEDVDVVTRIEEGDPTRRSRNTPTRRPT